MCARSERTLIYGPYRAGDRFRLWSKLGARTIAARSYSSREAAERAKPRWQEELDAEAPHTVGWAIDEYEAHLKAKRLKEGTVRVTLHCLRAFFDEGARLDALTPAKCKALYKTQIVAPSQRKRAEDAEPEPIEAATHHDRLSRARTFLGWCIEEGHLKANPLADVKPFGRKNMGKSQLTRDQAGAFLDAALTIAADPDPWIAQGGIAPYLVLVNGARASEVLDRLVSDLDSGGTVLRVPCGKTKNAARELDVPERIHPHLRRIVEGLDGDAPIFGTGRGPRRQAWLWHRVHEICRLAKVPTVCTQSLRGTFATSGKTATGLGHIVAAYLGHGSERVTQRHYYDAGQVSADERRRALRVLEGGRKVSPAGSDEDREAS